MRAILKKLEEKKRQLDEHRPFPPELVANLHEWFKIELTYTSNAIEGNTLSRAETALVVEKGIAVEGKTLQEHLEAVNHAQAFDWVVQRVNTPGFTRKKISERTILDLHQYILQKIMDSQAGRYRSVPVRIAGSTVVMPNAMKVPQLMEEFILWLHQSAEHPLKIAIDAHLRFVSIHPFVDGNGRTARLLMNLLLMQAGYPPAIIQKEKRKHYISSIEKVQLGGSSADYEMFMYEAIDASLEMYLNAFQEKAHQEKLEKKTLFKVGELAAMVKETPTTLRHWTKEGLLDVAEYSSGGYQLYDHDQAGVVKKIRTLQDKRRLTLAEIKKELAK
jgi:Fic family protein